MEKLRNLLTEYQLIVDNADSLLRPVDWGGKKIFSGKKKMHFKKISLLFHHSLKTLLRSVMSWAKSDINLLKQPKINLMLYCELFLEQSL